VPGLYGLLTVLYGRYGLLTAVLYAYFTAALQLFCAYFTVVLRIELRFYRTGLFATGLEVRITPL
jgi:hypothetical protein